jgi:hypothetical protein
MALIFINDTLIDSIYVQIRKGLITIDSGYRSEGCIPKYPAGKSLFTQRNHG